MRVELAIHRGELQTVRAATRAWEEEHGEAWKAEHEAALKVRDLEKIVRMCVSPSFRAHLEWLREGFDRADRGGANNSQTVVMVEYIEESTRLGVEVLSDLLEDVRQAEGEGYTVDGAARLAEALATMEDLHREALRRLAAAAPASGPDGETVVVRIRPWAYLRAMGALFWTALRHPFTTSVIDLSTGKVVKS